MSAAVIKMIYQTNDSNRVRKRSRETDFYEKLKSKPHNIVFITLMANYFHQLLCFRFLELILLLLFFIKIVSYL